MMIEGLENMPIGVKIQLLKHLQETLGGQQEGSDKEPMAELNASAMAEQLKYCFATLSKRHEFKEGDLIQAKPDLLKDSMKIRKGQPLIVVEVLSEPVIDEDADSSDCDFRERFDIRAGWLNKGNFVVHHFGSEKFEPFITE